MSVITVFEVTSRIRFAAMKISYYLDSEDGVVEVLLTRKKKFLIRFRLEGMF